MEYKLIGARTIEELDNKVNETLKEGWILWGSPFGLVEGGEWNIFQSVTHFTPNPH